MARLRPALFCLLLLAAAMVDRTEGRRRKMTKKGSSADPRVPEVQTLEHGNEAVYKPADFDPRKAAADVDPEGILHNIVADFTNARYVSLDPPIVVIDDFITDEECEHIIKISRPGLAPSTGTGAYKNGKFERIKMSSRTSHNAWLMNGLEHDPWVRQVDRKIANATGLYHGNSEHYQVLRYAPGQFYKSHSDFISSQVEQPSGPRLFTFFLYLRDVRSGGHTYFPNAKPLDDKSRDACALHNKQYDATFDKDVDCGVLVKPKKGSAVIWPNTAPDDVSIQHPKTNHAALAIYDCPTPGAPDETTHGEGFDEPAESEGCHKWSANVWIHLYDFKGAHGRGWTG